jgi:hypothetical protein
MSSEYLCPAEHWAIQYCTSGFIQCYALPGPAVKVRTPDTPPEGMASRSSSNPPYDDGLEIAQGGGEAPASVAEAVGLVSVTNTRTCVCECNSYWMLLGQ